MTQPFLRLSASAIIALAALYAATHAFGGFSGDSLIYLGRALADVDPDGVGRDLMFRYDGQSRFSIFPQVAAWLAAHVSLLATAMILVAASSALWFGGLLALARRAAPDRLTACIALVILAPAGYGGFELLRYAETLAIPRPFAEAFVLMALAAYLGGRLWLAGALLVASALFHPIMALAGVATIGLALGAEDRRWLAAPVLAVIALVIAVASGAPLAQRLVTPIDPQWLAALQTRNAYLFPHLWPTSAFALPAVQAATLVLAATRAEGRLRNVLIASLVAGAAGLALAWACGLFEPLLLVVQAQMWRMWWLTAVLAALSLAICAVRLGRSDASDRLALAMLALAWTFWRDMDGLAALFAFAALFLATRPAERRIAISDGVVRIIWIAVALAVVAPALLDLRELRHFAGMFQPDYAPSVMALVLRFLGAPLLFGALALAAFGAPRSPVLSGAPALAAALVAFIFAAWLWNDASSYDRALGRASRQADLERLAPQQQGEILWLSAALEPWVYLHRPNWSAELQGAGGVFSRELATIYADRAEFQIALGLRDESMMRRPLKGAKTFHPALTTANLRPVCARPDAPAYIVAPVRKDAALDPELKAEIWTPPAVRVEAVLAADRVDYPRIDAYAVIDCANLR